MHSSGSYQEPNPETSGQWSEHLLKREFRWFLKTFFNNDSVLIAYTIGVSERAARLWITTDRLPRAEILYRIMLAYPAFAARLSLVVSNPEPAAPPAPRAAHGSMRRAS